MLLLENENEYVHLIKKSRFIGRIFTVFCEDEATQYIESMRQKYPDARHVCYAYITSNPVREKCYDDGEPKGTAGLPILNVLKRQKLSNILVVVVRYFGGIKLGPGGLMKAYMDTCIGLIKEADFSVFKNMHIYKTTHHLSDMQEIEVFFNNNDIKIINQSFEIPQHVQFEIATINQLKKPDLDYLKNKGKVEYLKTKYINIEK